MTGYCLDSETQSAVTELVALARDLAGGEPVLQGLPADERANLAQAARDAWLLLSGRDAPAGMGLPDFLRDLGRVSDEALVRFFRDDVAAL